MIVATVRTGTTYDLDHLKKWRDDIERHLEFSCDLVCLTDQPARCSGISFIDVGAIGLPGSWAKMILFEPQWRGLAKVIYLDLDVRINGDFTPLLNLPGEFAILEHPQRAIQPNRYSSAVMMIGGGTCSFVWSKFDKFREPLMEKYQRDGTKAVIQELYPSAPFLQRLLPKRFFQTVLRLRD